MARIKFLVLALAVLSLTLSVSTAKCQQAKPSTTAKPFKGVIKLDVRDSVPDWGPYTPKKAPKGAPNILIVLYDDTGLAAWSAYGGRINMPTLDKLAANGLTYSQFHTCALCSPTRSCILTGRNHHLNGMAAITEGGQWVSRPAWSHPEPVCYHRTDSTGQWLEYILAWQEPQCS